jgi:hypothetical protein
MLKVLFIPVSIVGGLIGGFLGKKLFDEIWGMIDEEEPPGREHRDVPWWKVIVALALEGAIFRVARGVVDRGSRQAFYRVTGSWPGEVEPEPE